MRTNSLLLWLLEDVSPFSELPSCMYRDAEAEHAKVQAGTAGEAENDGRGAYNQDATLSCTVVCTEANLPPQHSGRGRGMKTEAVTMRIIASLEENHRARADAVCQGSVKAPHSFLPFFNCLLDLFRNQKQHQHAGRSCSF